MTAGIQPCGTSAVTGLVESDRAIVRRDGLAFPTHRSLA
jgi:hypothetical protein